MEHFETLLVEKKGGIATLYLNRPDALNAINNTMRRELLVALEEVERDEEVRVMILTGKGRGFCAGGDVKGMGKKERMINPKDIVLKLANMEKPVICAVNGVAAGAGCSLAMAGDIVFASDSAKFIFSFVKVALVPDWGATYFLPRLVGIKKAKELTFCASTIDADEALNLGLINEVFPSENFESEINNFAERLASGPPRAISLMKKNLDMSGKLDLESVLDLERLTQGICRETEDHREGIRAFKEKREPKFIGE